MKLKESLYTASNMRNDPRWKHGDLTRIITLCNHRGVKGNFIECAIRGLQINSSNARRHFDTVRAIANEYLAAREAGSPIEVLTPREELKQLRSTATPAVVQKPTTAPGTVATPSTGTLEKLSEANAQLAEESTQLMARNAALEENALHVQAELRRREEQLVEAGKDAEVVARECEALRAANTNLLEEVEELQKQNETTARDLATAYKDRDQLRAMNSRNAERMYEAEAKAEELEADNTRLRRALLEQATCFATTLKALLPEA